MKWLNKRRGYKYDYAKRMWYKSWSKCHKAPTEMRAVVNKQGLKTFPQYCSSCHKPCKLEWSFKYD